MAAFVIGEFGIGFLLGKKSLHGDEAASSYVDVQRLGYLNIAIPVGILAVRRDDNDFSRGPIVANRLQHGMINPPTSTTLVRQHEKSVT